MSHRKVEYIHGDSRRQDLLLRRQTYLHNFYEEAILEPRSFRKENGKHPFGIEKADVEGYLRGRKVKKLSRL